MQNLINEPEMQEVRIELMSVLDEYVAKHDKLLPWQEFVREFGFSEQWNRSQAYFGLPLLE